jgi:hypothetical protein
LTKSRTRPGERVAKRRRCQTKVGANHKIKRDETVKWFKNRFEYVVFSASRDSQLIIRLGVSSDKHSPLHDFRRMGNGVNEGNIKATLAVFCIYGSYHNEAVHQTVMHHSIWTCNGLRDRPACRLLRVLKCEIQRLKSSKSRFFVWCAPKVYLPDQISVPRAFTLRPRAEALCPVYQQPNVRQLMSFSESLIMSPLLYLTCPSQIDPKPRARIVSAL